MFISIIIKDECVFLEKRTHLTSDVFEKIRNDQRNTTNTNVIRTCIHEHLHQIFSNFSPPVSPPNDSRVYRFRVGVGAGGERGEECEVLQNY